MSCICKKNTKSDEKCTHKSKPDSDFCGVHKKCKEKYKVKKSKSAGKKSAGKKSAGKKSAESEKPRCSCINSTSGERCKNKPKDGSKFCGVHKECKNPVKSPRKSGVKKAKKQEKDKKVNDKKVNDKKVKDKKVKDKKVKKDEEDEEDEEDEDEEDEEDEDEEDKEAEDEDSDEKHENENINLEESIGGTSYSWRNLGDALKPTSQNRNIDRRWTNIADKNEVLEIMRNVLWQSGQNDDIIKEKPITNLILFINFIQEFSTDTLKKVKIFTSMDKTFQKYAETFIQDSTDSMLKSPIDKKNIPLHVYLALVDHFLYFFLTKRQKITFVNKYIDSILKSYKYTLETFPVPGKDGFILPDKGKLAIYQTLIVLYDVLFGNLDE